LSSFFSRLKNLTQQNIQKGILLNEQTVYTTYSRRPRDHQPNGFSA
jgi:hypothetical protein